MAAGSAYEPIATTTLGSNQGTVTFSSISQSYTHLRLVINGGFVDNGFMFGIRVGNGTLDTAGNYSFTWLRGNASVVATGRYSNMTLGTACEQGKNDLNNICVVDFLNYSSTTQNKIWLTHKGNPGDTVDTTFNLWRSNSAINTIAIAESGNGGTGSFNYGNMLAGTTFTLYGIVAA